MNNQNAAQPSELEGDLKKLKTLLGQSNKPCLFNLIIFGEDARQTSYFHDIIRMISGHFPFRTLFIQNDPSLKAPFLRIKLTCESENPSLPCDQITFTATGEGLARIPFIILPHLVPDLPVYLLWGEDPTLNNPILPQLQNYATRLIFDSEGTENLQQFCQSMLKQKESFHLELNDLNWARIGGWREILSETFDNPEKIQHLSSAKSIKITFNNRASDLFLHPETQSIYLQAWLASRLKWEYVKKEKEGKNIRLHYNAKGNPIEILLQGESFGQLPAEEIMEIEVTDPSRFLYSLKRKGKNQVLAYCHTMDRCELPLTLMLSNIWTGKSFIREVFYQKISEQYFQMLHLISKIKWN